MEKQNKDSKNRKEQAKIYKAMSLMELRAIKPKWAYGRNINKLLNPTLHPTNQDYEFFFVKPSDLIKCSEFYEVNTEILFTGESLNDHRVTGILFQWENKGFIDPPSMYLSENIKGKLFFNDGRHRTKLAYHLGCKRIPIAIHNDDITEKSDLIKLSKIMRN